MFKLDMQAIRRSADAAWLTANLANPANSAPEISQRAPKLATVAGLAISHDSGEEAAALLTAQVIAAAMRACDHHGDGEEARAQMRADIEATPHDQRADLLAYFRQAYPGREE
ncbi:hypothetical protein GCM10007320_50900 [Pseudorhodoferax aquiterrae]|uniref:Uncharacterized protein n=1 Tax=Pseudorhodoferax aquiterrae TaxID=747304 RepID=A0ABQ3G894_9BURK|nr:hypothetical protein [Pseudorhodoferax aquiterrae]GHC96704.1 hypothetical protein GCM10007320_50900 [Pseudorhodoferax aquiterrae]